MSATCPDCERPRGGSPANGQCMMRDGDNCRLAVIAKLRRELANALAVNSGRTYCSDSPEVLKARVGELERELAEARAIGELERAALERSVQARQAELHLREHHPDNAIQTEHWKRRDAVGVAEAIRSNAVDALLAARAATGEKEADRG